MHRRLVMTGVIAGSLGAAALAVGPARAATSTPAAAVGTAQTSWTEEAPVEVDEAAGFDALEHTTMPPRPDIAQAGEVLSVVADRVFALGSQRGLAGMTTDDRTRTIDVYWKGRPPADVASYLSGAPGRVRVDLHVDSELTRREEQAASVRVMNLQDRRRLGIVSVSSHHDGSGVTVGLEKGMPSTSVRSAIVEASGLRASQVRYRLNLGTLAPLVATRTNKRPTG